MIKGIKFFHRLKVHLRVRVAVLFALSASIIHFFVALSHEGPVALPDVTGYLSVAQWLDGGQFPERLYFFPGYGVLISPLVLLGITAHTAALVCNAILAGGCVWLAVKLFNQIEVSSHKLLLILVAALATIHPSLSVASRVAWPETVLITGLLILCLCISKGDTKSWRIAGVVVVGLMAFHPRFAVLLLPIAGISCVVKRKGALVYGAAIASPAVILLMWATKSFPSARLDAAINIGADPGPAQVAAGQLLTLAAGTGGLALVGLFAGLSATWRLVRHREGDVTSSFLAMSAVSMIALGGWVLAGSDRPDTLLYSRLIDPWSIPLTLIGLQVIIKKAIRFRFLLVGISVNTLAMILVLAGSSGVSGSGLRIMGLSLGALWWIFDGSLVPVVVVASGITLSCIFAWNLSNCLRIIVPVSAFILVAAMSTISNHMHLNEVGKIAAGQSELSSMVPSTESCLSYDRATTKSYTLVLYKLKLPRLEHRWVDLTMGGRPCGKYLIAGDVAENVCPEAIKLGTEKRGNWSLWRYPLESCG
jgi:hypothetical protein